MRKTTEIIRKWKINFNGYRRTMNIFEYLKKKKQKKNII